MQVDATSNRACPREGDEPPDFGQAFDGSGNQQQLAPGQPLLWSAQNRLTQVNIITRADTENDAERYAYDSSGQRLRKTAMAMSRADAHKRDVRYMPGLELRSDNATGEELEVIVVQAERCAVRCLHWVSGRTSGIENDQLRDSVDDTKVLQCLSLSPVLKFPRLRVQRQRVVPRVFVGRHHRKPVEPMRGRRCQACCPGPKPHRPAK